METAELIAVSALILTLLLMLKVVNLQKQLNELKADQWRNGRSEGSGLPSSSLNSPVSATAAPLASLYADLDDRLRMLIASGKKIQAIKEVREASGLGLKEAKDYVEALERNSF